jgi:hypothetical protein
MKLDPPDSRHGMSTLRLALTLLAAALVPLLAYAAAPAWWSQRGVLVPNATADDYAPVNQGQLKNIARTGVAEMDARLPGGAGDALHNLVAAWASPTAQTNDFAPANLGQLKNVAKPFYDRLMVVGLISAYPWSGSSSPPDDFVVANIGQVKNAFSIDLVILLFDSDGNGLPDAWEQHYFGHLGVDPNADPDGDGLTNLQEFQNNTAPDDYYNGALPQLVLVAGDGQTVKTDSNAPRAFELLVLKADGTPLPNAPVTFAITSGAGLLAGDATPGAPLSASVTVRADYSGRVRPPVATVLFHANSMPGTGTVEASGGGAIARFSINVTIGGPLAAPVFLKSTKNPDGSALFEWSMSSLHIPEGASIILLARGPDGGWQPITTLEGSATSYSASAAQIALFTEFAVRIASPSGAQSALSNVVGDSSQRPTYSLIDLGQGTPYAVASDGTVVLDRPYGTSLYYRSRGGIDEPLGENFYFSDMNDTGDIVGTDGYPATAYAIFSNSSANGRTRWSEVGHTGGNPGSGSFFGTNLTKINENKVIVGQEDSDSQVHYVETDRTKDFLSTAPLRFQVIASSTNTFDLLERQPPSRSGEIYTVRDLNNHQGGVGVKLQLTESGGEEQALYFGAAPRPTGDSAFRPFALNDEGLVLGRSDGVIKFWEPLFGAFHILEVPNPVGNYEQLRVTDPPPDPDAPTFILAGNNLVFRTWKDADGQPSAFPIYTTRGATDLLPPDSPFYYLNLQNISNNGIIVATARKVGDESDHAVMLVPVAIVPDSGVEGKLGGMVGSSNGRNGEKHFVSPPNLLGDPTDDYVTFVAKGVPANQMGTFFKWDADPNDPTKGEAVPGEPLKWRVKRDVARRNTIRILTQDGNKEVAKLNVWVVSGTIEDPSISQQPTLLEGGLGKVIQSTLLFTMRINPSTVITDPERPKLQEAAAGPGGVTACGKDLRMGANMRWDISRQVRLSYNKSRNFAFAAKCEDDRINSYPTGVEANIVGNDDAETADEVDDPYPDNKAFLTSLDNPSRYLSDATASLGDTIEFKMYFREFGRLKIGDVWFRISDFKLWRTVYKFVKVDLNSRETWAKDPATMLALDNAGL